MQNCLLSVLEISFLTIVTFDHNDKNRSCADTFYLKKNPPALKFRWLAMLYSHMPTVISEPEMRNIRGAYTTKVWQLNTERL